MRSLLDDALQQDPKHLQPEARAVHRGNEESCFLQRADPPEPDDNEPLPDTVPPPDPTRVEAFMELVCATCKCLQVWPLVHLQMS